MRTGLVQGSHAVRPESESRRGQQAAGCCLLTAVLVLGALGAVYCKREGLSGRAIGLLAGAGATVLVGLGCLMRRRAVDASAQPPPGPQPSVSERPPVEAVGGVAPPVSPVQPSVVPRSEQFWTELLGPVMGPQVARAEQERRRDVDWDGVTMALLGNSANWVHYPRLADVRFDARKEPAVRRPEEMAALQGLKVQIEATGDPQALQRFIQGACAYFAPRYLAMSPARQRQHEAVLADMSAREADLYPLGIHLMNGSMAEPLDADSGSGRADTTHALEQIRIFREVHAYQRDWEFARTSPIESAYTIHAVAFLIERSNWTLAHGGWELMSPGVAGQNYLMPWARNWKQAEFEALTSRLRGRVEPDGLQPLFNHWYRQMLSVGGATARDQQGPFREMMRALGLVPPAAPAEAT